MENKICFKIRFPFVARSENSWPFDKFKVYANFVFQVVFQKLKNEKQKLMTDFRFSGGRKTNGPLIHAFIAPPKSTIKFLNVKAVHLKLRYLSQIVIKFVYFSSSPREGALLLVQKV